MLFIFDDLFLLVGSPVSVLSQYLSKCILIFNSADFFVVLTIHSWMIDYVYTCIFCRNYYLRKIQVLITWYFLSKLLSQKNSSPYYFWNCIILLFLCNFFFTLCKHQYYNFATHLFHCSLFLFGHWFD